MNRAARVTTAYFLRQRIRETSLKLGNSGEQLQAVAGVPGTGSLAISIAQSIIEYATRVGQHWFQSLPSTRSGGVGVARELCKMRSKPG